MELLQSQAPAGGINRNFSCLDITLDMKVQILDMWKWIFELYLLIFLNWKFSDTIATNTPALSQSQKVLTWSQHYNCNIQPPRLGLTLRKTLQLQLRKPTHRPWLWPGHWIGLRADLKLDNIKYNRRSYNWWVESNNHGYPKETGQTPWLCTQQWCPPWK